MPQVARYVFAKANTLFNFLNQVWTESTLNLCDSTNITARSAIQLSEAQYNSPKANITVSEANYGDERISTGIKKYHKHAAAH